MVDKVFIEIVCFCLEPGLCAIKVYSKWFNLRGGKVMLDL